MIQVVPLLIADPRAVMKRNQKERNEREYHLNRYLKLLIRFDSDYLTKDYPISIFIK